MASNSYRSNAKSVDDPSYPATNAGQQEAKRDSEPNTTSNVIDLNDIIEPYDNILLGYENVTYHWKLYTFPVNKYKEFQTFQGQTESDKVIIAESGVTGTYTIDTVEMRSTAPGTSATKNGTALSFTMDLMENRGMYFIDEMAALSINLGYKKFVDIPLVLELSFIGFDPNSPSPIPVTIPNSRKRWRVNIDRAPGKVSASGTMYNLQMSTRAYGIDLSKWMLGEQSELITSNTVGSALSALEEKMNSIQNAQYGYWPTQFPNDIDLNSYFKIFVQGTIGDLSIIKNATQDTLVDADKKGNPGGRKFNFKGSQTLGSVIDEILDCAVTDEDAGIRKLRQFVHVIPFQFYVGYDKLLNREVYRYEVYVVPYQVADIQDISDIRNRDSSVDMKETLEGILTTNDQQTKKINMRRYDYMFSGLNTEIISLDISMDSQYNHAAVRNIQSLIQEKNFKGIKKSDAIIENQILNSSNQDQQYATSTPNKETKTSEEQADTTSSVNKQNAYSANTVKTEGESSQARDTVTASTRYLEDFNELYDTTNTKDTSAWNHHLNIPIDYRNLKEVSSSTDTENASDDEVIKRSIKSNYYNDAFMRTLDIEVIGDPYWLGNSEETLLNRLRNLCGEEYTTYPGDSQYTMNNITAEPYLLLNLEPPRDISSLGLVMTQRDQIMSQTVYRIFNLESTFSGGKFTQRLKGGFIMRSVNRANGDN
ncbi:hypothetical protein NVP2275O_438 [Vibrio phage 2.275.O._10N.286.54.E11]|nr:hypothetical protein NVP2275O_438 [Vibrio phage 2.275.O._10N.286.54.E11]